MIGLVIVEVVVVVVVVVGSGGRGDDDDDDDGVEFLFEIIYHFIWKTLSGILYLKISYVTSSREVSISGEES